MDSLVLPGLLLVVPMALFSLLPASYTTLLDPTSGQVLISDNQIYASIAFCICGIYSLLSWLLLRFPLWAPREGLKFDVQVVAHRGGKAVRIENTLSAFHQGVADDADVLELDVQLTKDGKVVVFHDRSLSHLTGVDGAISDFDYSNLPDYIIQSHLSPENVKTVQSLPHHDAFGIPLLDDVFARFPGKPIFIDLKIKSLVLVEKTCRLIQKHDRQSITVWGSLPSRSTGNRCFAMDPSIPIMFSGFKILALYFSYWFGLLPFLPLHESLLVTPNNIPLPFFNLRFNFLSSKLCSHLNKRGIAVMAFGVPSGALNDTASFVDARRHGVNSICSDNVKLLTSWMEEVTCNAAANEGGTVSDIGTGIGTESIKIKPKTKDTPAPHAEPKKTR